MSYLVADAFGLNYIGPVGDERCRDTAFVIEDLVFSKRCVAGVCPRSTNCRVGVNRTRLLVRRVIDMLPATAIV